MKGKKQCFGLLLLLSIMVGLSLNVSSNVSAGKYPIDSFSFGPGSVRRFFPIGENESGKMNTITYEESWSPYLDVETSILSPRFNFPVFNHVVGHYVSNGSYCEYDFSDDGVYSHEDGSSSIFYIVSRDMLKDPPFTSSNPSGSWFNDSFNYDSLCNIIDYEYTALGSNKPPAFAGLPAFDVNSIPPLTIYRDYFPHLYNYQALLLNDTPLPESNLFTSSGLSSSDLFDQVGSFSFNELKFHLNLFKDGFNDISDLNVPMSETVNRFRIGGYVDFGDDPNFSVDPDTPVTIYIKDYTFAIDNLDLDSPDYLYNSNPLFDLENSYNNVVVTYACNFVEHRTSNGDSSNFFYFSCPVLPANLGHNTTDFRFLDVSIDFKNFSSTSAWTFRDFFVVTNDDWSPVDMSATDYISGGAIGSAPGSVDDNVDNTNYFTKLINLFGFTFFNPFLPIFNMFSDQSQCAQIPTLSFMLHSTETQVCPWFPSSVRTITTPVLSMASVMLVFGFAVRWLGSSSGNLFEDSGSHDISSSYTLKSKYRRKK